jgi:hypothetical protein
LEPSVPRPEAAGMPGLGAAPCGSLRRAGVGHSPDAIITNVEVPVIQVPEKKLYQKILQGLKVWLKK